MDFTDAKGRVWCPKVTARVVRDFELKTGRGLLQGVADAILQNNPDDVESKEGQSKLVTAMFKIGSQIFDNVGNMMYLLFEACHPKELEDGKVLFYTQEDGTQDVVTFDDFCEAVTSNEIASALSVALNVVLEFFPLVDSEEKAGERKRADPKKPAGHGATSLNTPLSRVLNVGNIPSEK